LGRLGELARGANPDPGVRAQDEQVLIAGQDEIRAGGERGGQDDIVVGIAADGGRQGIRGDETGALPVNKVEGRARGLEGELAGKFFGQFREQTGSKSRQKPGTRMAESSTLVSSTSFTRRERRTSLRRRA